MFLVVFILYTSLYIQYTAKFYGVGADYIYGVQIRYMIPLVAILSIISNKKELPVNRKYLWIGAIFIDFIFLLNVIITF